MTTFTIIKNLSGYHIYGKTYHYLGMKFTPLYHTCHSYKDCIEWLNSNCEDYKIVFKDKAKTTPPT